MANVSLVAIDGMNLLRRVFEANPDEDSPEKAEKACTAAMSTFRRAVYGTDDFEPTHGVAVFDADGINWRHKEYPAYKAHRTPMSANLRAALPGFCLDLKEELGLASVQIPGVEADDVIGTLVQRWTQCGTVLPGRLVVAATDKDLFALSALGAEFRDVFKREWVTKEQMAAKLAGVPPELAADFLALVGDATDGVPGVPRIGPKTAAAYLTEYGSLEALLKAAAQGLLKGKAGESVKKNAELARLSRRLVTLRTDVTLGITWRSLQLH